MTVNITKMDKESSHIDDLFDPEFERQTRKGCPSCGVPALIRIPRTFLMKLFLVSKAYRCSACKAVCVKWFGIVWEVNRKSSSEA